MSGRSRSKRSTGSAAIVEDLFKDFSSGLEFEPEKLVTTAAGGGAPPRSDDEDSADCRSQLKEKKRDRSHRSRQKHSSRKKKRSSSRDGTEDRSSGRNRDIKKKKKKRHPSITDEDGQRETQRLKEVKREPSESPAEHPDPSLSDKSSSAVITTNGVDASALGVNGETRQSNHIHSEKSDSGIEIGGKQEDDKTKEMNGSSGDAEEEEGPVEPVSIKAVKLSDYLREKGHEVPKSVIETEAEDEKKVKEDDTTQSGGPESSLDLPLAKSGKETKLITTTKDKPAAFLPRNLQLKSVQDAKDLAKSKDDQASGALVSSGVLAKQTMEKVESVANKLKEALKKKPAIRELSPPIPSKRKLVDVSESEDEGFVQAPVSQKDKKTTKKIVFGALKSSSTFKMSQSRSSKRHHHHHPGGEEGEIPSSDEAEASTDGELMDMLGDSDGELESDKEPETKALTQNKVKKLKKKKVKKEKKRKRSRSPSPRDKSRRDRRRRHRDDSRDRDGHYRRRRRSSSRDGRRRKRRVDSDEGKWAWSRGTIARQRARDRSRSPNARYRRRSPSSSSEKEEKDKMLDKKELFEIARKNASAMLQAGTLQQIRNMSAEEIATLRSGGKSVDELVDYCKKLQRRADRAKKKADGLETSSESEKSEEGESFINHPFVVNQAKIIMNIPNATPLPARTPAERAREEATLRLTFPVSSGEQHRNKEPEWTPVVPLPIAGPKEMKALPAPNQTPAAQTDTLSLPPPPPPPSTAPIGQLGAALEIAAASEIPPVEDEPVFENPPSPPAGGIGDIVSKRLEAVKRLQSNPTDVEAMKLMHCAEEQMKKWAASKNLPGQFTGSTGVKCLAPNDLGPTMGGQAWARRDQLRNTKAVDSGVGMYLLQKMGWRPGEGLGRSKAGTVEPLTLDIKSDRRGLISLDEMPASKARPNVPFMKDMQGKHPVSALMEVCGKRRWGPPSYTCVESGPSNNRRFLWKVVVNGVEYQPATPSGNKKEAKAQASQVVLQSLGLVPRNNKLPVVIA